MTDNDIWIDAAIGEAVVEANKTSYTYILNLPPGVQKLQFFAYDYPDGHSIRIELPPEYEETGRCSLFIDGKPIDVKELSDRRVELHFPLGMHEHAKKDKETT